MSVPLNINEFDLLRQLIEQECGITIGNDKVYLLEARLSKLTVDNDCDNFLQLYQKIKCDPTLKTKVIDAITTNETLWFRDNAPYEWLKSYCLPEFSRKLISKEKAQIHIWSAACSTGQEPYSISMSCHEYARTNPSKELLQGGVSILATDISSSVLFLAQNARYDALTMSRGMTDELKQRYFDESGRVFILKDDVKKLVNFQKLNLMNSFNQLGKFDLILLRNVAIYFSKEIKIQLFRKMAKSLNPGGYLLLGASESLIGYSTEFEPRQINGYNFYQLKSQEK